MTRVKHKRHQLCPTRKYRKTHTSYQCKQYLCMEMHYHVWRLPWVWQLKESLLLSYSFDCLCCNSHEFLFLMVSFRFCKQVRADMKMLMSKHSLHVQYFILSMSYFYAKYMLYNLVGPDKTGRVTVKTEDHHIGKESYAHVLSM